MKQIIAEEIKKALESLGITAKDVVVLYPEVPEHGDFATSAALAHAKEANMSPKALAEKLAEQLKKQKIEYVEGIEIAGPGFINFRLSRDYFANTVSDILDAKEKFGTNKNLKGKKVIVEFTDPNLFKEFHIGHLMSNAIGESLARILEWNGASVTRMCYQSDVGLNVAKAMWGMQKNSADMPAPTEPLAEKTEFLGESYVVGAKAYAADAAAKTEIDDLNKLIYQKSPQILDLYNWGKEVSLAHFEEIYKTLGTKFDVNVLESEVADEGLKIVKASSIFQESEGAVVFKGEDYGLHTRVFVTSQGLPTYEAKELGLIKKKFKSYKPDESISITGNEQNDYFKVVLKAFELIKPEEAKKMIHISHGMMRLSSGKMSSREGNIVTGESLINDTREAVYEKMKERNMPEDQKEKTATTIAVAAIKYSILKQAPGNDIVYDIANSTSFEGDSGPYLQYAHTRALSVLAKAKLEGITSSSDKPTVAVSTVEKLLSRFPDVVSRAHEHRAPQLIVTYLTELASAFNAFYAGTKIADAKSVEAPYNAALTEAFGAVMKNGLHLIGVGVPEKM